MATFIRWLDERRPRGVKVPNGLAITADAHCAVMVGTDRSAGADVLVVPRPRPC